MLGQKSMLMTSLLRPHNSWLPCRSFWRISCNELRALTWISHNCPRHVLRYHCSIPMTQCANDRICTPLGAMEQKKSEKLGKRFISTSYHIGEQIYLNYVCVLLTVITVHWNKMINSFSDYILLNVRWAVYGRCATGCTQSA